MIKTIAIAIPQVKKTVVQLGTPEIDVGHGVAVGVDEFVSSFN